MPSQLPTFIANVANNRGMDIRTDRQTGSRIPLPLKLHELNQVKLSNTSTYNVLLCLKRQTAHLKPVRVQRDGQMNGRRTNGRTEK